MTSVLLPKYKCSRCGFSPSGKQRSNNQNRYLHGYIIKEISEHTGYTTEEVKEIIKSKFLKSWKIIKTKQGDKEFEYIRGTSELDTKETEDLLRDVREWASLELGLYLALPNEVLNENS